MKEILRGSDIYEEVKDVAHIPNVSNWTTQRKEIIREKLFGQKYIDTSKKTLRTNQRSRYSVSSLRKKVRVMNLRILKHKKLVL